MKVLRVIMAILREVFEESAYERFCAREGVGPSRVSYANFLLEADRTKRPKVRCC